MRSRLLMVAALLIVGVVVFACSTPGASVAPSATPAAPSVAASEEPPAASEEPPAASEEPSAAAEATVEVGTFTDGEFIVAGSNQMTVYIFTKDVKDSGKSECTGGCLETWPALTVPAGATPTAGSGVTGDPRHDHPRGRRHPPGDVQRPAALLLQERRRLRAT